MAQATRPQGINAILDCTTQDDWGCIHPTPARIDITGQPNAIRFSDASFEPMYLHGWTKDFQGLSWKDGYRNDPRPTHGIQDIGGVCDAIGNGWGPVIVRAAVLADGRVYVCDSPVRDEKYTAVALPCLFQEAYRRFVQAKPSPGKTLIM